METIDNIRVENDREHETVADIAAVLRRYGLPSLAERLEAAWKRERAEIEDIAKSRMLEGTIIVDNRSCGNAAAMREALEEIIVDCRGCMCAGDCCDTVCKPSIRGRSIAKALAALSAPARNCDCYDNEDEAESAYREFRQREIDKVPLDALDYSKETGKVPGKIKWLLAPAAERKGDGDDKSSTPV